MTVPSQLSNRDVTTLIDIMNFMSKQYSYQYLEIGSYLGASLQWHLETPNCIKVVSIDKRSRDKIKDERQIDYAYTTTTQDMLNALTSNQIPIDKLIAIDGTVDDIPKDFLFDLVFIDAEHTNQAVFYDTLKCYESMKNDSIIMMHDDWIVYKGIEDIENYLADTKQVFRKFKMPNCDITVIVMGNLIDEFEITFGTNCVSWPQFVHNAEKSLAIEIQKNKGNKK
jgi:predicted O-methyltransferase YrrM